MKYIYRNGGAPMIDLIIDLLIVAWLLLPLLLSVASEIESWRSVRDARRRRMR